MQQKKRDWESVIWERRAYNADKIIEALSLPRLVVPIVTVTVGYPAQPLPEQVERLPLAAVVHQESYVDYTPESIDELYSEKEALEVNKQFVKENNKETLAQVFTDVVTQRRIMNIFRKCC